mmetsp:Transcript_48880/g.146110  ORF Transcript_48880/g.146110 Transcript_48880/m.146110 type:complete len:325 (-) Transcript_48880:14-988(-)
MQHLRVVVLDDRQDLLQLGNQGAALGQEGQYGKPGQVPDVHKLHQPPLLQAQVVKEHSPLLKAGGQEGDNLVLAVQLLKGIVADEPWSRDHDGKTIQAGTLRSPQRPHLEDLRRVGELHHDRLQSNWAAGTTVPGRGLAGSPDCRVGLDQVPPVAQRSAHELRGPRGVAPVAAQEARDGEVVSHVLGAALELRGRPPPYLRHSRLLGLPAWPEQLLVVASARPPCSGLQGRPRETAVLLRRTPPSATAGELPRGTGGRRAGPALHPSSSTVRRRPSCGDFSVRTLGRLSSLASAAQRLEQPALLPAGARGLQLTGRTAEPDAHE